MDLKHITDLQEKRTALHQEIAAISEQIRTALNEADAALAEVRQAVGLSEPKRKHGPGVYQRSASQRQKLSAATKRRWAEAKAQGRNLNDRPVA